MNTATRTAAGFGLAALAPVIAWAAWVPGRGIGYGRNVGFFVTVAVCCVVAGALAVHSRRRYLAMAALVAVTTLVTLVTLWLWWSAEDATGLFAVGVLIAAPLVLVGAALAVGIGAAVERPGSAAGSPSVHPSV